MSSTFKFGSFRSGLRPSDQEVKNEGRIDAGEALVAGGIRAAVANKQAENHIASRAIVSRKRKARNGYARPE